MTGTRYKRGMSYAADMAHYARMMAGDNSTEHQRLKRNLVRALKEEVTQRQRETLLLYYAEGLTMQQIAARQGVNPSVVSRHITRGEARLRRCLRYGAAILLQPES
ncbi:hypothetical protein CE91St41_10360 [Oscillospiraceae bacterium]|nr:hypothetical protein CE91St40_27170 [Oscillospiraceae bacterium]BDF74147.1 hypothetical protein CE91St41_10360 [Oscillospiraceae bacterium]